MENILPLPKRPGPPPRFPNPLAPNFNVDDNTQSMNTEHINHTWTLCLLQPRINIEIGGEGGIVAMLASGNVFSIYGPHDHCACTL